LLAQLPLFQRRMRLVTRAALFRRTGGRADEVAKSIVPSADRHGGTLGIYGTF